MTDVLWSNKLERIHTSYLVLVVLAVVGMAVGLLFRIGVAGRVIHVLGGGVRGAITYGFLLWERLFSWASWLTFLAVVSGFLAVGLVFGGWLPGLRVICGLSLLFMGVVACLAYMFIDRERVEVERGHKAVHNPLKGQVLAKHLARHGQRVHGPLLMSAAGATVVGFALLNQGLFETVGHDWYEIVGPLGGPIYADFLVYAIVKLLGILDVLDLAKSHHLVGALNVRDVTWQASSLLAGFKMFFTLVLLQQLFSSLRQRKLLGETIIDFWSPHQPIHERARDALPQFGVMGLRPLLISLRDVPSLTKELRERLPVVLATVGPSVVPSLIRHLSDPHEHVRCVVVGSLGLLRVQLAVPVIAALAGDPSEMVRQSVVEALGGIGAAGVDFPGETRGIVLGRISKMHRAVAWFRRNRYAPALPDVEPITLAVETLKTALGDASPAVRALAAASLGRIGAPAAAVAPALMELLKDGDDTARARAAEALGRVGGEVAPTVTALIASLQDATPVVKAAAARTLGEMNEAAASAIPALLPLLHDRDESVREAVASALAHLGPLDRSAIHSLIEGLDSEDNVVRAHTAEALGTIGAAASEAAPALVAAMEDDNDRVRAKAVKALGDIGESAASAAVPGLVRALKDHDNWVSALAAEALGQMGESSEGTVNALTRALRHANAWVRANSAEALGRMGAAATEARRALEAAAGDEDAGVRSQAIRALGVIGPVTETSLQVVLTGLDDADSLVRIAAVESLGRWDKSTTAVVSKLSTLLEDPNEQVRSEVSRVLPQLSGATPEVIAGLSRRLLEDTSGWVQVNVALALGKLGPAAARAGEALLRAVQTGEVMVREQTMRAIALIQPDESARAFVTGLKDASGDIRKIASAGWMKSAEIPDEAIPALVDALRDPEVQVRANAAHAMGRLDPLPPAAILPLIECMNDIYDGVRMNAAAALRRTSGKAIADIMRRLLLDSNSRLGLIAASYLLWVQPENVEARGVLTKALEDPDQRVRKAAVELEEELAKPVSV